MFNFKIYMFNWLRYNIVNNLSRDAFKTSCNSASFGAEHKVLAPVVWRLDNAVHGINRFSMDKCKGQFRVCLLIKVLFLIIAIALKIPPRCNYAVTMVQLVVAEWWMTKILRTFHWILPMLSTIEFSVGPYNLLDYSW